MATRRELIRAGLAGAMLAALPACGASRTPVAGAGHAPLALRVLGGTGFLGPRFVEAALARGHRMTVFNRGRSNPTRFDGEAFAGVEQLRGDRKTDLSALEGARRWDAVLDTSAYIPADVTRSAAMPGRATRVRPGPIVGPGDPTDRFTYRPARADRGGEILEPGAASDPIQAVSAWQDTPVQVPARGDQAGFGRTSTARAQGAGLGCRSLEATVADTLAWWRTRPDDRRATPKAGLTPAREAAVPAAWHARSGAT